MTKYRAKVFFRHQDYLKFLEEGDMNIEILFINYQYTSELEEAILLTYIEKSEAHR